MDLGGIDDYYLHREIMKKVKSIWMKIILNPEPESEEWYDT